MSRRPASRGASSLATSGSTRCLARVNNSSTRIGSRRMRCGAGSTRCRCRRIPETFMRGSSETFRARIAIALIALAGFSFTLWVFFPGITTFDAWYVYQDMAKHQFGDWQSPAMLALWMQIDPIAPGTGSLLLLTVALYWLSFGLIACVIARRSPKLALLLPLLGLSPPAFVLLGVIWRDILFGVVWLLASGLAYAVAQKRASLRVPVQLLAIA